MSGLATTQTVMGSDAPSGNEVEIRDVAASVHDTLPPDISRDDFRGGMFDGSCAASMEETCEYAPGPDGELPEGVSYVLVEMTIRNKADGTADYDSSRPAFFLLGEDGSASHAGGSDPLWRSGWDGSNPKQYWVISIGRGSEARIGLLFALADDEIGADGLALVVDPGNASDENGFSGMKAFDMTGLSAKEK